MIRRVVIGLALGAVVGACSGTEVAIGPDACASASAPTIVGTAADTGVVLSGAGAGCLQLAGGAGDYLVSVQLATNAITYADYPVDVVQPGTRAVAGLGALTIAAPGEPSRAAALAFEARLRADERRLSEQAPAPGSRSLAVRGLTRPVPALGSIDTFKVISTLSSPYTYAAAAARLVYKGARVLAYVDVTAPSVYTDAEWAALGAHLEDPLYGVDTTAFGQPSDVDGNGHVIVLFTPRVNALVSQIDCARSGYVTGYFYAFDLASSSSDSNQGEIFFAYVPDPAGAFSCPHTGADVRTQLPATFVHEFQHMISYAQHAIVRGGITEEVWLNEGLSHLAEELASKVYEARYPAPTGRTSGIQLFPDSSNDFIIGDLGNAYRWLQVPSVYSPVRYPNGSYGTLEERGASWLLARYLVDRFGAGTTRQLVQTNQWGVTNVETVTGTPLKALLADFTMALWLDSVPGVPRQAIASPRRFRSRNLRQLFSALLIARPGLGSGFPLVPLSLTGTRRATLRPGTVEFYRVTVPPGGLRLAVRGPNGAGTAADWQVQVGVVRLMP